MCWKGGVNWELGMNTHAAMYTVYETDNQQGSSVAQGTLFSIM